MKIVLLILSLLIFPSLVFSADPPSLESPSNNSQVSSSKLTWQNPNYTLFSSKPFRVQVDNNEDFGSPEKDYYTDNLSYNPTLIETTWFWRVKVKDSTGTWSNWSEAWKFTLSQSSLAPPPPNSPPNLPPTSPQSQPESQKSSSKFEISNIPQSADINQNISVSISLTLPNNPNTNFYLKGAFYKEGSTNYFGYTQNVKNSSSYSNQYKITTDSSGNWTGNLEIRGDPDDTGFKGQGSYQFKVGRYTTTGSGPTWSNSLNINLSGSSQSESDEKTAETDQTYNIKTPTSTPTFNGSIIQKAEAIASVAGEATHEAQIPDLEKTLVAEEKKINWWLISSGAIILIFSTGLFLYLKKKGKILV